jgi:hypothetical protein
MTTADDRHDEDVWAQAVAEGADSGPADVRPVVGKPAATAEGEVTERSAAGEAASAGSPAAPPADLFGPELTPLVEEVRKFAATVGEKISSVQASVNNGDALGALQDLAAPLRVKHPEVYGHLIAAGGELLAAYRSAVTSSEKRWTAEKPTSAEHIDLD